MAKQYRQCMHEATLRRVRIPVVDIEKQRILNILSFAVALVIRHAQRMRYIILPSVDCPAVPYLSKLSHKQHDFREKVIAHKTCVLIFSTTFV
jgi:hypothetical protein